MIKQDEGFLLSIHEYREHDGFVYFLSKNHGLQKMVLPGYYRSQSKQLSLGLEFSKVAYLSKYEENKLNRITGGHLIEAYHAHRNLNWLLNLTLASELVIKFYQKTLHDSFYDYFESIIENTTQLAPLLQLLKLIFESEGLQPYVDSCVLCDSTAINTFSFSKGGFLCVKHSHRKDDANILLCIHRLFKDETLENVPHEVLEKTLQTLVKFLTYHSDTKINAATLRFRV